MIFKLCTCMCTFTVVAIPSPHSKGLKRGSNKPYGSESESESLSHYAESDSLLLLMTHLELFRKGARSAEQFVKPEKQDCFKIHCNNPLFILDEGI